MANSVKPNAFFGSFFLSFLYLSIQNTGFDFYHHAISNFTLSSLAQFSTPYLLLDFEVPRYILLSYSIFLASLAYLPPAIFLSLLISFPLSLFLRFVRNTENFLLYSIFLLLTFYLLVFFSATNLSLLYCLGSLGASCRRVKHILLLCSSIFSPFGFFFALLFLIFLKDKLMYNFRLLLFMLASIFTSILLWRISSEFSLVEVVNSRSISLDNVILLDNSIIRLTSYAFIFFIFAAIYLVSYYLISLKRIRFNANPIIHLSCAFALLLLLFPDKTLWTSFPSVLGVFFGNQYDKYVVDCSVSLAWLGRLSDCNTNSLDIWRARGFY